jgi:hypothetical protein
MKFEDHQAIKTVKNILNLEFSQYLGKMPEESYLYWIRQFRLPWIIEAFDEARTVAMDGKMKGEPWGLITYRLKSREENLKKYLAKKEQP